MLKRFICGLVWVTAACAPTAQHVAVNAAPAAACAVSGADRAWIERALDAWRFTSREITHIHVAGDFKAVFFDANCVLTSSNALTSANARGVTWTATPHSGTITLPSGEQMPAGVTSFTSADEHQAYLVMSTPSVWRAGGVDNAGIGLETMMVAVLLHEGSHVVQAATYGARIGALAERNHLPESFNDDSLQREFESNADFSASVVRETDLLFQAVAANDDATAFRLAHEARDLMKARAARWFVGEKSYWLEAEDVWLTFEGSGQWAGYEWVIDPHGAAQPASVAIPNFARRSRWWSQNEGLGIALTLDRLGVRDWTRRAFGDGSETLLGMLDGALAAP